MDGAYNRNTGKTVGTGMRLRMSWGNRAKYANIKYSHRGQDWEPRRTTAMAGSSASPRPGDGRGPGAEDRSVRFSTTDKGQGANMALPIYGYFMNRVCADSSITISRVISPSRWAWRTSMWTAATGPPAATVRTPSPLGVAAIFVVRQRTSA